MSVKGCKQTRKKLYHERFYSSKRKAKVKTDLCELWKGRGRYNTVAAKYTAKIKGDSSTVENAEINTEEKEEKKLKRRRKRKRRK